MPVLSSTNMTSHAQTGIAGTKEFMAPLAIR